MQPGGAILAPKFITVAPTSRRPAPKTPRSPTRFCDVGISRQPAADCTLEAAMHQVNEKIVTFLPPESIEPQAFQQLVNTSESPVLAGHLAVMPDCHFGKGSTVGSVIPTSGGV